MVKQARKGPGLKELMEKGEGLSGFAWPENCGDFEMRIARDGTWYYRGSPIGRKKLVQLFATVLQKDANGDYWLVTPVERGRIEVEDAPFVAIEMQVEKDAAGRDVLNFRTNLDHWVRAGGDHPIRVTHDPETGEPSPYIMVRDGLEALISRAVFYDLVERAEAVEDGKLARLILRSGADSFELGTL